MVLGLICYMVNSNKVRFATDVLQWLTTGMVHARANRNEM
jgi:hypothetical protein